MERNLLCAQYCIDLIRAVMQEQPIPEMPEGLSLQALFDFSKMHSVEAMVYHALSELTVDETDPVWQNWSNRAQMLLTQSIVQLADRDIVFEELTQAGIDLLPVKGSWLKEAYPQIDYRQMSDLDILIHREDRAKAKQHMEEMGYVLEVGEVAIHHDGYEKKPYTAVELHLQLLPGRDRNCGYYDDVWTKAKPVKGYSRLYRLSAEDEYIFYFLHMKQHMEEAGCGIRLILDCVVYRNLYPNMDQTYLRNEFEKLGIYSFVQMVEQLSDCWFASGTAIPDTLKEMADCVLWTGTYGSLETAFQMRMDALKKKYKNPAVRIIAYWCSRFCRPLGEMKNGYPILEKLPFLLPLFWVVRAVGKCIKKPAAILYHVKQIYRRGTKDG